VVLTANDYYAFGSVMVGREYVADTLVKYRYGMNTQEKDDEIYGKGNASSAEFWEYDTRLGRRWNIDPVVKILESSYSCFSNSPILYNDPNGEDVKYNKVGDRFRVFFGRMVNKDFKKDFKKLKNSENLYIFKLEDNSKTGDKGQFGYKDHEGKNELVIGYSLTKPKESYKGQGRWAAIYHESKHAIQFEKGRFGFYKSPSGWKVNPMTYDQTDEVEAWDAQLLFRKRDEYKSTITNRPENTVSYYYKELHNTGKTTYADGTIYLSKFALINDITGNGYSNLISSPKSAVNSHIKTRVRNNTEFAMPYKK